jgi:ABC-type multidrug transport system fused ATPase/permease subunit
MEASLYKFIIKYSWRQQAILTVLAIAGFVPYYFFLDIPKAIVNQGIQGKGIKFPVDLWGLGLIQMDHVAYLLWLCFLFIFLVVVQQIFKYVINVFQGISGERMLRRMRYELYARVLRFPLPTFRKMSQGEIIPMITAEVEPLGGFIAESFALPIFQGGMLLVTFIFLMVQNPIMGLAGVALYPLQFYVIPKLQRKVNALGKERVKGARSLADRIGESISGMQEIHAHHGSRRMLAEFTKRLGAIYWVRYEIYQRKFVIKFINNFMQQLGPFFFYSIGGYLVITGSLDVGTIVAAVAAQKEMGGPWKELLTHYQARDDARIKYEQVIAQFAPPGMRAPEVQLAEPDTIPNLTGEIVLNNVTFTDDYGTPVVDGVSLTLPNPSKIAVVGGTGRDELLQLIARLLDPSKGRITVGGRDPAEMGEAIMGRRTAFVGATSYMFNSTIAENLLLGLRQKPVAPPEYDDKAKRRFERELGEAIASGNSAEDPDAEWTDHAAAGVDDPKTLAAAILRALRAAQIDDDVYQLGLRDTIDPDRQPDLCAGILRARTALRERLADPAIAALVETWDRNRYNENATVAENLLFGTPVGDKFDLDRMARNAYMLTVLDKVGLKDRFLQIGYEVAQTMVELFADLPADHEFFQQFSFISSDDLPEFKDILARAKPDTLASLNEADRERLMSLPFKLIPARHRLGHLTQDVRDQVVKAREAFAADLPANLKGAVAFFDPEQYTRGANLLDNILFGKVGYGEAEAAEKVGALVGEVIDSLDLKPTITQVGLAYEVGIGGSRLSGAQRQKLALARAVVKRPDILLLSEATSSIDAATQAKIMGNVFELLEGKTIVWSLQRAAMAERFDRVIVVSEGRIVEQGGFGDLNREGAEFHKLLQRT